MKWLYVRTLVIILCTLSHGAYAQETISGVMDAIMPAGNVTQSTEVNERLFSFTEEFGSGKAETIEDIQKDEFYGQVPEQSDEEFLPATQDTNVVYLRYYFSQDSEADISRDVSGDYVISSGDINGPIPDQGYYWYYMRVSDPSFLPSGAVITNLEYRLRISYDTDPADFYCGDYEIYLSSEANGAPNKYLKIYDNLGGRTDGGYDDDDDDDSDIYLNWRLTNQFNGENPSQAWSVWVEDTAALDTGMLNYIQFKIYYTAEERPDLTCPSISYTSGTIVENSEFWVGPWIKNEGNDTAYESHARLFLSIDNDFDVNDDYEVLPKKTVPSMMPGAQGQLDWTFTFPNLNGEDIGVCYNVWLIVMVDCDDENDEWNENNIYKTTNSFEVSDPLSQPNLRPFRSIGKDDIIVLSSMPGTGSDTDVYENHTIYVDFAYVNDSSIDITGDFQNSIVVDGAVENTQFQNELPANNYLVCNDWSIMVSGVGWHTIRLVIDDGDDVDESDENDNVYERQFYLHPDPSPPDINVYPLEIHVYQ